jgi:integrase
MAENNINRKPLSALAVKNLKSGFLSDTPPNAGLRIIVNKSGSKSWIYRYRVDSKLKQIKLGNYPSVDLKEARSLLADKKKLRTVENKDPLEERNKQKEQRRRDQEEKAKLAFTVEQMCELYLSRHVEKKRTVKGANETRRTLKGDAVAILGHLPAVSVTHRMIYNMVDAIVERGASVQAGNVLRELLAAYSYSMGKGLFEDDFVNPCLQAKANFKLQKVKLTNNRGKRVLNDGELSTLIKWLPESKFTKGQKGVLMLTLLTGCRSGEACVIKWSDLNFDKCTWHLAETKTGNERYVQLSNQAVQFLKGVDKGDSNYVFTQQLGKPIEQKKISEQMWRMRKDGTDLKINRWSPHDLRRTVRTNLSKLKCPSDIAEAILGHTKGGVKGVYDLYTYEAECKEWLQNWCDYLDTLEAVNNLVPIKAVANA